ncbi:MAG: phosphoribosylaminoimidazole-succinocarboxamide synthase, partial [Planctomycetota bacterium]
GGKPTSFDKQYLRDWLLASGWNRTPPPPALPADVIAKTAATYKEIQRRLAEAK